MATSLSIAGQCTHLTHDSLGPSGPTTHMASQSVQTFFAQMTAECHYTLQWGAPLPLKIAPPQGGSGPSSNTWFLRPTRVLNPNSISIGAAIFAGLTYVTDATWSVTIGLIYVHSTAMWPKNRG